MATSARVTATIEHAEARRARERRALRMLGIPLLAVVMIPAFTTSPRPSLHRDGLVVLLAAAALLVAFAAVVRRAPRLEREGGGEAATVAWLVLMAAAGVALIAAQPDGTGALALSLVAWIAGARLPTRVGLAVVVASATAAAVALAIDADHPVTSIVTAGLLMVLLFLMARMYERAQGDRKRAEVAAAQLEDARERELRSAALAERARIARDLHDVLAHSLSGLSLQLESARLLAERDGASEPLLQTLARSRRLAADGLDEARRAVRALQGDAMPQLADLRTLVEDFAGDGLDVELLVSGEERPVAGEAALTIYRAAQEALTNVARHSGADQVTLRVVYGSDHVSLVVTDNGAGRPPAMPALATAGTGYGLSAMRERVALLGGSVHASSTPEGFRIELQVPA